LDGISQLWCWCSYVASTSLPDRLVPVKDAYDRSGRRPTRQPRSRGCGRPASCALPPGDLLLPPQCDSIILQDQPWSWMIQAGQPPSSTRGRRRGRMAVWSPVFEGDHLDRHPTLGGVRRSRSSSCFHVALHRDCAPADLAGLAPGTCRGSTTPTAPSSASTRSRSCRTSCSPWSMSRYGIGGPMPQRVTVVRAPGSRYFRGRQRRLLRFLLSDLHRSGHSLLTWQMRMCYPAGSSRHRAGAETRSHPTAPATRGLPAIARSHPHILTA